MPWQHIITYVESILRVYNRYGRRDNIWKARIKILVKSLGPEQFAKEVDEDWEQAADFNADRIRTETELERVAAHFMPPPYESLPAIDASYEHALATNLAFSRWAERNVHAHRIAGYRAVTLSLKRAGQAPGDVTADQMEAAAALADRYS